LTSEDPFLVTYGIRNKPGRVADIQPEYFLLRRGLSSKNIQRIFFDHMAWQLARFLGEMVWNKAMLNQVECIRINGWGTIAEGKKVPSGGRVCTVPL
jgi:hypothetical protein